MRACTYGAGVPATHYLYRVHGARSQDSQHPIVLQQLPLRLLAHAMAVLKNSGMLGVLGSGQYAHAILTEREVTISALQFGNVHVSYVSTLRLSQSPTT